MPTGINARTLPIAVQNFYSAIVSAIESREPFALGIISGVRGSSPQRRGAKALFFADGRIVGTLGGGCLEAEVRERARQSLRTQKPEAFDLVLHHDFGWDDGLICGGKVSGLILPHAARAETLSTLIDAARWNRTNICQPSHNGRARHPVLLSWKDFKALKSTPLRTMKEFLAAQGAAVQLINVRDHGLEFDIDTPDDYRAVTINFGGAPTPDTFRRTP